MVAGADVIHQSISVLDVQYRCISKRIDEIVDLSSTAAVAAMTPLVSSMGAVSERDPDFPEKSTPVEFIPSIRSGSFADIGPRKFMEDEHIRIDNLSGHLGSVFTCPTPSAFYGVFDGHGGQDAAAYIKRHATKLFFEDAEFPRASKADTGFLESVENSLRKAFLQADLALADDCAVSTSSGTTALAALILGRILLVANAGDCRAVLCRKGAAMEMSQDHRPIYAAECKRVQESGGYIEDGYLNGVLSVSRALGDWDMKLPRGSTSPLIAEPEFKKVVLTEEDEFLIIGCDGIWDVMSSQHAVGVVRRGLRRHDDPDRCARELVMEALRLRTFDNLTVIVVCFASEHRDSSSLPELQRPQQVPQPLRYCSLSAEALCSLRSWLEKDEDMN